jgi:tetratricopeptide (TPR) repeat protein
VQSGDSPGSQKQPGQPHEQASPPGIVWPAKTIPAGPEVEAFLVCEIDASIGRNKMQKATRNKLFNIESFSFKGETDHVSLHGAFYQQIVAKLIKVVYDTKSVRAAGNRLIAIADQALDLKQTETVDQISQLLANAPLPREYQGIGHYYRVFCLKRRGEIEQARAGFQRLAEAPGLPLKFRARALQALGVSYAERGDFAEAARIFAQAAQAATPRHADDLLTTVNVQSMEVIFRSLAGDHESALRRLETLRPLVHVLSPSQPLTPYIYVNSLAVELGAVGRLEEARRMAEIAMRSPYARVYPEWQETYDEIIVRMRQASPSVIAGVAWPQAPAEVAVTDSAATNVVAMPVATRPASTVEADAVPAQPGRVIAYHGWQRCLPEPSEALQESFTDNDLDQMSIADKQRALLDVIYSDRVTHHTLDQLLAAAGRVKADAPAS